MGGSGGGFFSGASSRDKPEDYVKRLREAEEKTRDTKLEIEVNSIINDLLRNINDRDTDKIQTHLKEIRNTLESEIEGTITLRYGGSVSKHTYVDGLSDVDSLVFLNDSELSNKTPEQVKNYFLKRLQQRYPNTKIKQGKLAVTLTYSDGTEIQILPAVKSKNGYKIPQDSNIWSNIVKPENFALSLRATNIKNSGKVLPVIKMAKSIISKLPDNRQLSGYHTEALAIETFSNYTGNKNKKEMLKHFFKRASELVNYSIKDKTGQSTNVDEYLGSDNSLKRKMVSDSLSLINRKMKNADAIGAVRKWEEILN